MELTLEGTCRHACSYPPSCSLALNRFPFSSGQSCRSIQPFIGRSSGIGRGGWADTISCADWADRGLSRRLKA